MSHKTLERLEYQRKANSNTRWVNNQLYRLMYKEDLYIVAYERMKSKPGNMTAGTDKETLDGFSLKIIREIIHEMRTEQFQFKPVSGMTHPYSIYIWQPPHSPRGEGHWNEPVQCFTEQWAIYVAGLMHHDSRSVIKVVR